MVEGGGRLGGCVGFSLPQYSYWSTDLCIFRVQIDDQFWLLESWLESLSYIEQ